MNPSPLGLLAAGYAYRPAPKFAVPKVVVSILYPAERIAILNRLDSSEPREFDDLAKIDRTAVEAGGELRAPGHFVQSERYGLECGADERQSAQSCQGGNAGFQGGFRSNAVQHKRRPGAGRDFPD